VKIASQMKAHFLSSWFHASCVQLRRSEKAVGSCTSYCKMLLFCVKTGMINSCNFEVEEEEEAAAF